MDFVIIESPYAGDVETNAEYARACLRNALTRGDAPFASHLLYTQVLADRIPAERGAGLIAAMAVLKRADKVAVYFDRGITPGMRLAIKTAGEVGVPVVYRTSRRPWTDLAAPAELIAEEPGPRSIFASLFR
jgi:hypothetical protein